MWIPIYNGTKKQFKRKAHASYKTNPDKSVETLLVTAAPRSQFARKILGCSKCCAQGSASCAFPAPKDVQYLFCEGFCKE